MILSLDPSSTRTGYAIFDDTAPRAQVPCLVECGVLTAPRDNPANARITSMISRAIGAARGSVPPVRVVIEDTSGKVNRDRHGGGGAGLAVQGKAVGWFIGAMIAQYGASAVIPVPENAWTRGVSKAARAARVLLMYPGIYDPAKDPGLDAADAIGLGIWFLDLEAIDRARAIAEAADDNDESPKRGLRAGCSRAGRTTATTPRRGGQAPGRAD